MNVMGYEVFTDDLVKLKLDLRKKKIINTINPHSYIVAESDDIFNKALKESDILIPDGSGIVLASKYVNGKKIKKIAGADLHTFLLEKVNKIGGKVFYMGASQNTLDKIEKRILKEYSNIKVSSYSPPFKETFSREENNVIISKINKFNPDVLFIGMTAPKQEKWLYSHKNVLDFKVASCIGAVFDFYAGIVERPDKIWIDLHLEWAGRLLKEPKRMWRRNFISAPLFLLNLIQYKLLIKKGVSCE